MQTEQKLPLGGNIALRYGLIFGLSLAAIEAIILVINALVSNTNADSIRSGGNAGAAIGLALIFSGIGFLLGLAAYFVSGIMAAGKTGRVATGTLAGLWTGLFYGIIGFIVNLAVFFTITLPKVEALSSSLYNGDAYKTGLVFGTVGGSVFGVDLAVGYGAGLGALGGLIGKNNAKVAPAQPAYPHYPPYQAQPYSDPYSAQGQPLQVPPYPGQPYPGQKPQQYPQQPYANPYSPQSPYPYPPEGGTSVPPTQAAKPDQPYYP
jgi:hypothetical protein